MVNDCQSFIPWLLFIMDWISFNFTSVVQSISCSMNESS